MVSKIPKIKKNIKAFLTSEEGKIEKKTALKVAFAMLAIGAMLDTQVQATCGLTTSHVNYLHQSGSWGSHTSNLVSHVSHCSHSSHGSHASHASW